MSQIIIHSTESPPCDEGLAMQNDYREQYSQEVWKEKTNNGKNAIPLEEMDTPAEFYAGTSDDRRFRYVNAKHEVTLQLREGSEHGKHEFGSFQC